jgi:hypothetical protein
MASPLTSSNNWLLPIYSSFVVEGPEESLLMIHEVGKTSEKTVVGPKLAALFRCLSSNNSKQNFLIFNPFYFLIKCTNKPRHGAHQDIIESAHCCSSFIFSESWHQVIEFFAESFIVIQFTTRYGWFDVRYCEQEVAHADGDH